MGVPEVRDRLSIGARLHLDDEPDETGQEEDSPIVWTEIPASVALTASHKISPR